MRRSGQSLGAAAALALLAAAAPAPTAAPDCANGYCTVQMTAPELLRASERLVLAARYDEAKPLVAALAHAPEYAMEQQFLEGYIAVETGDLPTAVKKFRAVLAQRPDLTRARLELGRALMLQGKDRAADYHLRLAQDDDALPHDIARTIEAARGAIRDRRTWDLNVGIGFAPDTNINGATSAQSIDVRFGDQTIPLTLDENARRKTGLGQTGTISAGVRLRMADGLALVVDADGYAVNYEGKQADDMSLLFAAGPELTIGGTHVAVAATAAQRWYGGDVATRSAGVRVSAQRLLGAGSRVGVQIDARRQNAMFNDGYDGWQLGSYLTYEQVIDRSAVATVSLFARSEPLAAKAYSSREFGLIAGIGGELPWGLNAGVSAQAGRATYQAALPIFGEARRDWRLLNLLGGKVHDEPTSGRGRCALAASRHRSATPTARPPRTSNSMITTVIGSNSSWRAISDARLKTEQLAKRVREPSATCRGWDDQLLVR